MSDLKLVKLVLGICALMVGLDALSPDLQLAAVWQFLESHGREIAICTMVASFLAFLRTL